MKKKDVLMLIPYCIPWVFLMLYADYSWSIAWQYGLILAILAVGAGLLHDNGRVLVLGNILSLACSLLMVYLADFHQMNDYFKPFTAAGWVAVLTGISGVMQMLVWKKQSENRNR